MTKLGETGPKEDQEISQEDLSNTIRVRVTVLDESAIKASSRDNMELQVNIHDNVEKILDVYDQVSNVSGFLILNGNLVEHPEDTTFQKINAIHNSVFTLNCGDSVG
jgi:hypothetical protein